MSVATTNTVGYYNGNKWPIEIAISELGVNFRLAPGQYIKDSLGRNVNDSFFDKYTKPFHLSKELSKNGPVPLLAVPRTPVPSPSEHQHPVRAVSKFTENATGQRVPVLAPLPTKPKLAVNTPTHKGMSMEEARRLGFVGGAVREVPEDYGVTDTDGSPSDGSKIPPIKYATESQPKIRQSDQLPAELTQVDEKLDPNQAATRQQLVSSLSKASSVNVESATSFMNQVEQPQATPAVPAPAQAHAQVQAAIDEALPAPNLGNEQVAAGFDPSLVVAPGAAPVKPVVPDLLAEAKANAKKSADAKAPAPKTVKPFVCAIDGNDFRYRSELERYAKRKYPDKVAEILAPYPVK